MPDTMAGPDIVQRPFLLGDEAVAQAAIDAGISAAYAYPGTPSTEAFEYLARAVNQGGGLQASWCVNEKVAMESALGVSMVGRRSLAVMKHVGLNVAADPFINAAIVSIHGGLVLVVADDPGMHSSQNEQDSRFYADFARIPCLEPCDHQQAYDMTREAFALSERFEVPVMVRLVTRLAHTRGSLEAARPEPQRPLDKIHDPNSWILLPVNARRQWQRLVERQSEMLAWSEGVRYNVLDPSEDDRGLGVITTGVALGYYRENLGRLDFRPSHLHVGAYPVPVAAVRALAERVDRILVLEDGYPYLERQLRGLLPTPIEVQGRVSGEVPATGELDPDVVARTLGLPADERAARAEQPLPPRPPQLCQACPHRDSYGALLQALSGVEGFVVTGDIGCYTLGALPPYRAIESCVCMGAAVGMARGASEAGSRPAIGVIGDSTFLHSGIPALLDAAQEDTDMTLLILDNGAIGMTGAQDTAVPSSRLEPLVLGLGIDPDHCHVVDAHPRKVDELATVIRREIEHPGLSVIIAARECIEHARRRKKVEKKEAESS